MAIRQYIGPRFVPKFMDTYDATQAYEALSVVDNGLGTSYISKIPTPAGTPLSDTTYWALYGTSNGAIINLQNQIDDINSDLGDITNLNTPDTSSVVNAINSMLTGFNKVILISDSYGNYGTPLFLDAVAANLGLSSSDYFTTNEGSSGFVQPGVNGHVFLNLLQNESSGFTHADVSHIIVLGGANDSTHTESDVVTAIGNFFSYALSSYPNAKIVVGMVGNTRDATKVRNFGLVSNWYNDAVSYHPRGQYLNNSECILKAPGLMSGDGIHPNNYGVRALAAYCAKAIKGEPININRFKAIAKTQNGVNHNIYTSVINDVFSIWSSTEKSYPLTNPISISTGTNIDLFDITDDSYVVGSYYQDCACPCVLVATPGNVTIAGTICLYGGKLQFRVLQKGINLSEITELQIPEYNVRFATKFC